MWCPRRTKPANTNWALGLRPRVKLGGTEWDPARMASAWLWPVGSVKPPKQDHEIAMFLNFFDELRRRVPVGKSHTRCE